MGKKFNLKRRIIMYVFGVMAVLMGCFFCTSDDVEAAEAVGTNSQIIHYDVTTESGDVPDAAIKPINKGKKYISKIVVFVGWAFIVFGIIFFGLSWMSHQTDQRVIGIIAAIVGGLVALAPTVAEWLIS